MWLQAGTPEKVKKVNCKSNQPHPLPSNEILKSLPTEPSVYFYQEIHCAIPHFSSFSPCLSFRDDIRKQRQTRNRQACLQHLLLLFG